MEKMRQVIRWRIIRFFFTSAFIFDERTNWISLVFLLKIKIRNFRIRFSILISTRKKANYFIISFKQRGIIDAR